MANAADLVAAFQDAAVRLTGGELPSTEALKYAAYFQQTQRNNAASAAAGQTYESPMSAEAYIRENNADAIAAHDSSQRALDFLGRLGVGPGAAPTTSTTTPTTACDSLISPLCP